MGRSRWITQQRQGITIATVLRKDRFVTTKIENEDAEVGLQNVLG
jgi:hypothetical protein